MLNVDMSYKYCATEHFNSKVVQYQLKAVQEKFQAFVYLSESHPVVSFCMNRHRGCKNFMLFGANFTCQCLAVFLKNTGGPRASLVTDFTALSIFSDNRLNGHKPEV